MCILHLRMQKSLSKWMRQ